MSDVGDFIDKESIHEKRLAEFMQWDFIEVFCILNSNSHFFIKIQLGVRF